MRESPQPEELPQTLISHLLELRNRLLKSMAAIMVIFLGLFYFSRELYTIVAKPLIDALPEGASMIATDVAAPFIVPFKLTLYLSIFVAMPVILHQAWAFIAPGLYRHEKRIAMPLLVSSVLLFYLGAAFAYFVVFPLIFAFFTAIAPEGVAVATDISRYLDFVMKLFLAFGFAFELPIAIVLMVWTGMTTVEKLKTKRPYIIVGCFVAGMLLTPPDILSQTLLAIPMWVLFEFGLLAARWVKPREQEGTGSAR
ncbi:MAG: twin-arginine translocase subunit TatC [Alcanivorax sp.]|nr:twin-arginine translocase subunit TatC [Alcanivorax sp.]